jgi:hypothetical protein
MLFGDTSQAKWQKKYIDAVFKKKTKFSDTFSKVILNNPELLSEKIGYLPKSLYKFYPPSSANIMDIKKKRLWLCHPRSFNDPFDCHTGYDVEGYAKAALLRHTKKTGTVDDSNLRQGFTSDEVNRLLNATTSDRINFWGKKEQYWMALYHILETKEDEFKSRIYQVTRKSKDEVAAIMNKLRNRNIRVASFSALERQNYTGKGFNDIIEMWSHYADNHKGFCVEYDISSLSEPVTLELGIREFYGENHNERSRYLDERVRAVTVGGLFPVIYTANRINIPTTKLRKIKVRMTRELNLDGDIDGILFKTYIVKSAKWSYEKEWRLILDGNVCSFFDNKIPFPFIKKIYLGCRMDSDNINILMEIAEELKIEVVMMKMDDKKFILEEEHIDHYKLETEMSKSLPF